MMPNPTSLETYRLQTRESRRNLQRTDVLTPARAVISSAPDIVYELQKLTPNFALQNLVDSAEQSVQLFKDFCIATASSTNNNITTIRAHIKREFGCYCEAIKESIITAQEGYNFARDGVELCGFIEEGAPAEEITSFINDMVYLARKAQSKAESTSASFRTIRTKLHEIGSSIPWNVGVQGQKLETSAATNSHESFHDVLRRLSKDIKELGEHVSAFADWWIETETKLSRIRAIIPQLNGLQISKLRLRTVIQGWQNVSQRYSSYKQRMAELQDLSLRLPPTPPPEPLPQLPVVPVNIPEPPRRPTTDSRIHVPSVTTYPPATLPMVAPGLPNTISRSPSIRSPIKVVHPRPFRQTTSTPPRRLPAPSSRPVVQDNSPKGSGWRCSIQ